MFHGVAQTLCIGCTARLDNALPQEREELLRQMLDSPDPVSYTHLDVYQRQAG